MIQCHTFNSFARLDLRDGGPYVLLAVRGRHGRAAVPVHGGHDLRRSRWRAWRGASPPLRRRWLVSLRRAGYILGIALPFRLTNCMGSLPGGSLAGNHQGGHPELHGRRNGGVRRGRAVRIPGTACASLLGAALAIAAAAPVMAICPGTARRAAPRIPGADAAGRGRFPVLPLRLLPGFRAGGGRDGEARGRRDVSNGSCSGAVLVGLVLVFAAQYLSNLPYSIYSESNFWTDSPALVLIRVGICAADHGGRVSVDRVLRGPAAGVGCSASARTR